MMSFWETVYDSLWPFSQGATDGNPYEWWDRPQTGTTRGLAAREAATGDSDTETGGQAWSLRDMYHTKREHPGSRQHRQQVQQCN
jgi:hypothetical protein